MFKNSSTKAIFAKSCRIVALMFMVQWLSCVPVTDGTDAGEPGSDDPGVVNPGDPIDPGAGRPALEWPAPQSGCAIDEKCADGLVCQPLSEEALAAFLESVSADEVPADTPVQAGTLVCQRGCRIDGAFITPDGTDIDADGCQSCQPDVSTNTWTPAASGTACDDGFFCTSDGGAPGDADRCDGAGNCIGDPVNCDDGLFCTGVETCNEETDSCEASGDPCPGTDCNACQEDADSCFDPAGSSCGSRRDTVCDNPDTCDGAGVCQNNFPYPNAICRAAAGICDVAETCDGRGECPEDLFKPVGTTCNQGSGDMCDPDEVCTGSSALCPDDSFASRAVVCNQGTGDLCDPDELCPGVPDQTCPDDQFEAANVVCNPGSGDMCDPDELCPGVPDQGCPADTVMPSTTVCRSAAGACDQEEMCRGVANMACPQDDKEDTSTECRAAAGDCDVAEVCDGVSNDCPEDKKLGATVVCRESTYACDDPEVCDGINNDCPADDSPCEDGSVCDLDEQCESGACIGGTCARAAATNGVCDSDADCQGALICDGQVCKVGRDGACPEANDCAVGLACDDSSSVCLVASGETCIESSDCANGSICDGSTATCRAGMNGTCFRSEDCSSGLICACDNFKTFVCQSDCEEDRCDTEGTCKAPPGGDCARDSDCGIQRSIDLGEELYCPSGTCEYKLALGDVCQVDPPGETCDPACVLPPSPNDNTCASGTCFLRAGNAPPYTDPPDFVCCSELGDPCVVDEHCCVEPRRRQRICSNSVCVRVAIAGEPCQTTSDCDQFAQGQPTGLECNANHICEVPPPTPGTLPNGSTCTVAGDCVSLHCAQTRDDGFKCLPLNEATNGSAGFGEVCDGDGFLLRGDPDGRQCTDTGGEMVCCAGGMLAASGEEGRCRGCCRSYDNDDPIGCGPPPSPNSIEVKRCVGGNGPTTKTCDRNRDCPGSQQCIVVDEQRCCGGRCTNILFDAENCGGCGNDCAALEETNVCTTLEGCGIGRTPGVCEFSIPCDAPDGFYPGCYDSREDTCGVLFGENGEPDTCSGIWPLDPAWGDCVDDLGECWDDTPAEATCYIVERESDTLCENCSDDSDCTGDEGCYSHCGGGKQNTLFGCAWGGYCAERPGDCDD